MRNFQDTFETRKPSFLNECTFKITHVMDCCDNIYPRIKSLFEIFHSKSLFLHVIGYLQPWNQKDLMKQRF